MIWTYGIMILSFFVLAFLVGVRGGGKPKQPLWGTVLADLNVSVVVLSVIFIGLFLISSGALFASVAVVLGASLVHSNLYLWILPNASVLGFKVGRGRLKGQADR